jgi:hypothetical protein
MKNPILTVEVYFVFRSALSDSYMFLAALLVCLPVTFLMFSSKLPMFYLQDIFYNQHIVLTIPDFKNIFISINKHFLTWHFLICLQCTVVRFIPTIFLPHFPSPTKNNFDMFHCSIFMQIEKVHWLYSPSSNLSIRSPPTASIHF